MRSLYKWIMAGTFVVSGTAGILYCITYASAMDTFRQGLQFKVEDIADSDKNGLSVDEMVDVCNVLGEDPARKLRRGFYLFAEDSQKYLKAKGQFDPLVDATYDLFKSHPSFTKAEAEGKPVHHTQF